MSRAPISSSNSFYNRPSSTPVSSFREAAQNSFINEAPSVRAENPVYEEVPAGELSQEEYPLGSAKAQLHKNYIVSQTEDAVFLVDQHAAHERIVYERIKSKIEDGGVEAQIAVVQVGAAFGPVELSRRFLGHMCRPRDLELHDRTIFETHKGPG